MKHLFQGVRDSLPASYIFNNILSSLESASQTSLLRPGQRKRKIAQHSASPLLCYSARMTAETLRAYSRERHGNLPTTETAGASQAPRIHWRQRSQWHLHPTLLTLCTPSILPRLPVRAQSQRGMARRIPCLMEHTATETVRYFVSFVLSLCHRRSLTRDPVPLPEGPFPVLSLGIRIHVMRQPEASNSYRSDRRVLQPPARVR
mmetsp:Transcript_912/g.1963  ORF Transcript_912/g.1963 Transcript_912/m.1963 type:complete len:204 (+) Transcript_912:115-726(+)